VLVFDRLQKNPFFLKNPRLSFIQGLEKAESGVSWPPKKFGAEVRNCISRLCRTGVKVIWQSTVSTFQGVEWKSTYHVTR